MFARQTREATLDGAWCVQGELAMLRAEVVALASQLKGAENRAGRAVSQPSPHVIYNVQQLEAVVEQLELSMQFRQHDA